ncbi:mechanosensitive ion channel family protein [Pleurocapsales cyanobacterium LEGE 10410]|nr:mechanosensitive ion channel family protein [Pleurocapsales cyanobacterium LEGE 10410]
MLRSWLKKFIRRSSLLFFLVLIFNLLLAVPLKAQLPFLPQITWETFKFNQTEATTASACVRLDGRCIFSILDQKSNLPQRIKYTEERLKDISQTYFAQENVQLKVYRQEQGNQQNIYVSVGDRQIPVITLSPKDATARGINLEHQAQEIVNQVDFGLRRAKQERSRPHLIEQTKLAGIIILAVLLGELTLADGLKRSRQVKNRLQSDRPTLLQSFADHISQKQKLNLRLLQYRLLQVVRLGLWLGGVLLILSLFPQTRSLQIWLITLIRIPLRIAAVSLAVYILIRLSNILIAKLNKTLAENYVLSRDIRRRMQVRITTITRLIGSIMAIFWIALGVLAALTLIGFDVTPLLAGAGILGLAFSFASQNIIKDVFNGFFIILEDQYAVGDVINVGTVGGLVENLNLRITQLRDGQGRLITIPNSEIKTVANLSSQWSRAEIDIPVAYQANIDRALELIGLVGQEMERESEWQEQIIEPPEVLGVDNFSDRGSVVRIWIKTEPLKQWAVAREFRRRLQKAFEEHNIPLATSQQKVWLEQFDSQTNFPD